MSDLYKKLTAYREKLRDEENKHTPTAVISDAALKALARSKPTELDDMLKVSGIGRAFVTKYGEGFLDIIVGDMKPVKLTMMRSEVKDTLKNLQSRLTNINRRNRMLYLPKVLPGKAIDLASGKNAEKAVDALLSIDGTPVVVASDGDALYMQYKRLMRTASAGAKESGSNMLYAGYPFVTGKCGGDNSFNVMAPLVLFPIKLVDDDGDIVMSVDTSREVTYNNALILCFNKFNRKSAKPLPPCGIDEIVKRDFLKSVISFYAEADISIAADKKIALSKYPSYTEKTFPKYGRNAYELLPCAVAGLFPMYSGALQKDFDDIIEAGVMPPSLVSVLEGADEIADFYGSSTDVVESDPLGSEADVDYINELNISQETAIERAQRETALVMQGPPGTGKSQTITSMISDAVGKGKSALVVSQKRAALSVIYSRLGRLSRYALFVDDPKDKDAFYNKLKSMFDAEDKPAPFNNVAYKHSVEQVDGDIADLEEIASLLTDNAAGVPMIDIYRENLDNPFKTAERATPPKTDEAELFRACVTEKLFECGYDELVAAKDYLDDDTILDKLGEYYTLGETYPWLIDMKKNMSGETLARLMTDLDKILDIVARGGFKFKLKKAIKLFTRENFEAFDRKLVKTFVKDPVALYNGVKAYDAFHESKLTADSLDFATRLYFGTLYNLKKETGKDYRALDAELLDYCGYAFIDRFETEHRDVMSHIATFPSIVSNICKAIDRKVSLTRDKTLNILKNAFNMNIADSKRRGEMMRAIDGKRRPSLSKFVEKFDFELFRGVKIFLMTPEAVSEILPLQSDLFDILVFDEASQIYVERGIPAIARAKRIVVCGDCKQLRPSSLGDGRITVDEDEESEAVLEEESLLDIARFKFKEVMLSYHYRSRYEELIAFSNAAFYGGKLIISPNPAPVGEPPISVHKVNGKWEDRVNVAEAEKVIELISHYFADAADLPPSARDTLGVITFNAQQRDCILDLIDKKCRADAAFSQRYKEEYARTSEGEDLGLFVKNIENVQGDERDRIIFSFAYAYNKKGIMSRNFGWLNRPGGENRLNVAISRAKRKIDIVTSIIPVDLKVDDIKSEGVHVLRKYLDYAYCVSDGDRVAAQYVLDSFAVKDIKTISPSGEKPASLKERLLAALAERGIDVVPDVGMGGYKIDLAVKNASGDYVLGIECDDSALKFPAPARERDVMRRRFLSSRGWQMLRVWSSDYYADPDGVVKEIVSRV